ncbi:type II toxin-antitoxin system RelE/ParE family toxin [Sphingomonas qilianensis]|uniref:Type II toxin-antitoxin system RelE/ParE family toxin n=1 Tax=Sphingomonas qilianensis TaxID=1736690 RepID=A0ABU9XQB0_9SPHN
MSHRLRYLPAAEDDIRGIARYIATHAASREIGTNFAVRLHDKCARIAELPGNIGTPRPEILPGLRSTPFQSYVIFFRYRDGDVEIVNVLHASRDAEAQFHG